MPGIKINYQNFVERCKKLHNDKYTYPNQEIKKPQLKVEVKCVGAEGFEPPTPWV
jgi:hypothetical protein